MSSITGTVEVKNDHLVRLASKSKPIPAISELIWNSLDADANVVKVNLVRNPLNEPSAIEIIDDGNAIPFPQAENLFGSLGGSWKRTQKHTKESNRFLHGQNGEGRFQALQLGRISEWDITCSDGKTLKNYQIAINKDNLRKFQISELAKAPKDSHSGVVVCVSELGAQTKKCLSVPILHDLEQIFALYLRQYPEVKIYFEGVPLDVSTNIQRSTTVELPNIVPDETVSLEIVEWNIKTRNEIYLCNGTGFPIEEITPSINTTGFNFTAYLKSEYFAELFLNNQIDFWDMDPHIVKIIDTAKEKIRDHFRELAATKATGLIEEWKEQKIYPFTEAPKDTIEEIEQQMFNVVALNVNQYLPSFETSDSTSKRMNLRLLRSALEKDPSDLKKILAEILELPDGKRRDLAKMLDYTTLTDIISATKTIAARLEFIKGLESLLFDKPSRENLKERQQLHRIIAENVWIFGEQYNLSVDDQSLTTVLKNHAESLKLNVNIDKPVLKSDGKRGIVDLMLSRKIQQAGTENKEHLIVELKRPKVQIGRNEINQILEYATAVATDERFESTAVNWQFWVVGNSLGDFAKARVNQSDRRPGLIDQQKNPSISVWVKTWAQIIADCNSRLQFFSDELKYVPTTSDSLQKVREICKKYVPDLGDAGKD